MSNPRNPLDQFSSSSYFHVLIVCDSEETATELVQSNAVLAQIPTRDPSKLLEPLNAPNGGRYVVLIDGSTDAQYVIDEATWTTVIASNLVSPDGPVPSSAAYCDGELIIHEPYGVRFMDVMAECCDVLRTDPSGLVFVLKTYFIGFTDINGTVNQKVITNVRPFLFIMTDLQAQFSETGAIYKLEFVGASNGVSKLPQINNLASSVTVSNLTVDSSQVSTLKDVFEKVLPASIKQHYDSALDQFRQECLRNNIPFDANKIRPVEIQFRLDPAFSQARFGSNELTTKQDRPGVVVLSFTGKPSFEIIIDEIMRSSKEVMGGTNNPDTKKIYKVTSSLRSTPTKYVITYYIFEYQLICENRGQVRVPNFPPPNSSIEFDYIFTGKNLDILEFDLKVEMGLAFFQVLGKTKNIPTQKEYLDGIPADQARAATPASNTHMAKSPASVDARDRTPWFFGGRQNNPTERNKNRPVDTTNFMSMLARQAALENVQTRLLIRGNPQLLNEISTLPSDYDTLIEGGQVFEPYIDDFGVEQPNIAGNWMKIPIYVKINIVTPAEDQSLNFGEKFWYDGYYQVFSVKNMFVDGAFKQELEMFSLLQTDEFDRKGDNQTPDQLSNANQTQAPTTSEQSQTNGITRSVSQSRDDRNRLKQGQ